MKNPSNRFTAMAAAGALALVLSASSAAAQTSLELLGDKDCFGTGWSCVEDGVTPLPDGWLNVSQDAGDPWFTDMDRRRYSGLVSWTHTFTPDVTSAFLQFRTVGIADVTGPYDVFVDGLLVGSMPAASTGHYLVKTFTFDLAPSILADGEAVVSFTAVSPDVWAIDYSEVFGTVPEPEPEAAVATPEPGTMALFGMGIFGLGLVVWRRREEGSGSFAC